MSDEVTEALRRVPLFQGMSDKALARVVEISKSVSHPAGKTVLEEDRSAVGFHLILSGHAEAKQHGSVVSVMGPGDYFGEMSLIDGDDRMATVRAESELRCAAMSPWTFRPFVKEHPEVAWALLTALVKRIRETQARHVAAG
jgi:CRP/FNR family cyclic AMP-dependent transcriptional regulator